ncbi:MAG TPA: DegT/DnrJ/EryC1/StrS family aminotransferase [Gaiellaceae bacterium]
MPEVSAKRSEFLSFQPPAISDAEIEAVAATLRSGWLTTGPRTAELEARMRDYLEARHVLAVSSGTAALHLSLVALGVGPGDEVITTSLTWPATANVIVHTGATPVFADIRDDTLNIDADAVRSLINERTKAIMPVDLYGQPADLDDLMALGLPVVEDAAHAVESRHRGRKVGAICDLTCFSLYATKNIAAGEGGLISTNRDDLAEAIDDLRVMRRGHGSTYDIAVPGYKANLSDVLSSIALVQLDKIEEHAEIRKRHVAIYEEGIAGLDGVEAVGRDPRDRHANHLFVVRVTFADRDVVQQALGEENIGTSIHFLPVHRLSAYRDRMAPHQPPLPVTERAGDEVLSLPLSPAHSDDDVRDAVAALHRVHARLAG